MKKLFTAFAAGLTMFSVAAAPQVKATIGNVPVTADNVKLQKVLHEAMQREMTSLDGSANLPVQTRSWTDQQGTVWDLSLTDMGNDIIPNMVDEQYQEAMRETYDAGLLIISSNSSSGKTTRIPFLICWPLNGAIDQDNWSSWGIAADADPKAPMTIQVLINSQLPFTVREYNAIGFVLDSQNYIQGIGCLNLGSVVSSRQQYIFLSQAMGLTSVYNGTSGNMEENSTFKITAFDPDMNILNVDINGFFETGTISSTGEANLNRVGNILLAYSGESYVDGFEPINKTFTVSEAHIINCGNYDLDTFQEKMEVSLYDDDFGPFNRYYLMLAAEGLTWPAESFEPDNYNFTEGPWLKTTGVSPENFAYMRGAFYTTPDNDGNYGGHEYKMVEPKPVKGAMGLTFIEGTPEEWTVLFSGYNGDQVAYAEYDGMQMVWKRYYSVWQPNTVSVQFLTKEGMIFKAKDQYNDNVNVKYAGEVIYHYDPSDFTKTRTVSAVGENAVSIEDVVEAINNNVRVVNGEIVIGTINDANVAVYAVNGAVVANRTLAAGEVFSVRADKGIYIVKVGDKAVKVVL